MVDETTKILTISQIYSKLNHTHTNVETQKIPSNSDLDSVTYQTPGIYYCESKPIAKTILNTPWPAENDCPKCSSFTLVVLKHAGIRQIIFSYATTQIYTRNFNNTTWSSWVEVYGEHNFKLGNISTPNGVVMTNENGELVSVGKLNQKYIRWDSESSKTINPVDIGILSDLGANRLAFLNHDCIDIFIDNNGTPYSFLTEDENSLSSDKKIEINNRKKQELLSGSRTCYCGGPDFATLDANKKLIVNIRAKINDEYQVYTYLRKLYIHSAQQSCTGTKCSIKLKEQNSNDTINFGEFDLSIGPGWTSIPLGIYFGDYNEITNFDVTKYDTISLTFSVQNIVTPQTQDPNEETIQPKMFFVDKLRFIGEDIWVSPSTMAETGNIYQYDGDQNVVFPNQVIAESFKIKNKDQNGFLKNNGTIDTKTYAESSHSHNWTKVADVGATEESPLSYKLFINEKIQMAELFVTYTTQINQPNVSSKTILSDNTTLSTAVDISNYPSKGRIIGSTRYGGVTVEVGNTNVELCGIIESEKQITSSLTWHY